MGEGGAAWPVRRAWGWAGGWTQEPRARSSSAAELPPPTPPPNSGTRRIGVSPGSEDTRLCRSRRSRRRPRGGVSPAPHPPSEAVGPRGWASARRGRGGRRAVWGRSLAFFGGARVPSGSFSNFPEVSRDGAGGGDTIYRAGDRWSCGECSLSVRPRLQRLSSVPPPARPAQVRGGGCPGLGVGVGVAQGSERGGRPPGGVGGQPRACKPESLHFGGSWRVRLRSRGPVVLAGQPEDRDRSRRGSQKKCRLPRECGQGVRTERKRWGPRRDAETGPSPGTRNEEPGPGAPSRDRGTRPALQAGCWGEADEKAWSPPGRCHLVPGVTAGLRLLQRPAALPPTGGIPEAAGVGEGE